MTTARGLETRYGSPPPSIISFEDEISRRLAPVTFFYGLQVLLCRKELDLLGKPTDKERLEIIGGVKALIFQASLGVGERGLTLDEKTKEKIQNVFVDLGFTSEEVNIPNLKRLAKEGVRGYVPSWAIRQVEERMARNKRYAAQVKFFAADLVFEVNGETGEEIMEKAQQEAIKDEASDLVSWVENANPPWTRERLRVKRQIRQEKARVNIDMPYWKDRLRFLTRKEKWLRKNEEQGTRSDYSYGEPRPITNQEELLMRLGIIRKEARKVEMAG